MCVKEADNSDTEGTALPQEEQPPPPPPAPTTSHTPEGGKSEAKVIKIQALFVNITLTLTLECKLGETTTTTTRHDIIDVPANCQNG